MSIIKLRLDDVVELKKPHPCGDNKFKILRVGGEVRVLCLKCGRDMVMDRIKLEKSIKRFITKNEDDLS